MDRRSFLKNSAAASALMTVPLASKVASAGKKSNSLIFASPGTPQSLDSEFDTSLGTFDFISACYDSLIAYDTMPDPKDPDAKREDLKKYPDRPSGHKMYGKLAESWKIAPDMTSVTFNLRKGVKSHWGNELTAEDVKWSWDRKLAMGAIGGFFASVIGLSKPEQIQIDGKYTVSFRLDKPAPMLMRLHRNPYNNILDSKKCKEVATSDDPWAKEWLKNNVAGYGPYNMVSIDRGTSAVAKARKDYWNGKPAIDTFIMQEVTSSSQRAQLVKKGSVDVAQFLTPLEVASLKNASNVAIDSVQSSWMDWLHLNCAEKPFNDKRVRQAMNYAFPKAAAIKSVYQTYGKVLEGVMPDIYPGYVPGTTYNKQNLDKARDLLKDAGYPNGFETYVIYDAGQTFQEPLLVLYRTALEQIGVKLTLKKTPSASYFKEIVAKKHPMTFYRDAPWSPDPGYALNLYYLSSSFVNYSNYNNPEVDKILTAAASEGNAAARFEMLDKCQSIILDDAPVVLISNPDFSLVRNKDLKGYTYRTYNHTCAGDFYWA